MGKPAAAREYPLEPLRVRLFHAIAGVMAIIGLLLAAFFFWVVAGLGLDLIGIIFVALPLVLFGGIALAIVAGARAVRLELTEDAVTLRLPGTQMTSSWDNVESIGPAFWGPLGGAEALNLRRPARLNGALWFKLLFTDPSYQSAIPLSPFALPLAGSRLEADLRSRLPGLFDARDPSGIGGYYAS